MPLHLPAALLSVFALVVVLTGTLPVHGADRWVAVLAEDEAEKLKLSGTLSQSLIQGLGRQPTKPDLLDLLKKDPVSTLILTGSFRPTFAAQPSVTTSDLGRGVRGIAFRLFCVDAVGRVILPDSDIVIFSDIVPGSGAHDHDDAGDPARPLPTLDPTSGNTGPDGMQFRSEFTSPEVAGVSLMTAICTPPDGGQIALQFSIAVRIQGLQRLPTMPGFQLVGGTTAHPLTNNHFGTTRLNSALAVLTVRYKAAFPNAPDLRINDQSLQEGGLFDLGPSVRRPAGLPPFRFWEPPHRSHRFGVDVDMGFVPLRNRDAFARFARQAGFTRIIREGDHNHLRVAGGPS